MKQIIFSLTFLISIANSVIGQDSLQNKPNNAERKHTKPDFFPKKDRASYKDKAYYLQKSRSAYVSAWILSAGGTVLTIAGYLAYNNNKGDTWDNIGNTFGGIIAMTLGGLSIVGSIPLFIASSHYKKKAMSASAFLKIEQCTELQQTTMFTKFFPALTLKISL